MNNQKLENLLNLSLDADENERERSEILDVGYDPIEKEWELIVKYSGDIDVIRPLVMDMTVLLNEYMIVTVRESVIDQLSALPQVEYIEKPKRLYFQIANGKRVSCIDTVVQGSRLGLSGKGVLIGIIDSGIDYSLDIFLKADGSTRIRYLWDQTNRKEYMSKEINQALNAGNLEDRYRIVPGVDSSGHGTAVAGIAADVAPESELIVVKMGLPRQEGFPRTTELMRGVDYVIRKSIDLGMPVAVNISFGNSYGAHNGQSLVERYLDSVAGLGRCCICVGAGNEGVGAGHASGIVRTGEEQRTELAVQEKEAGLNVQIWKNYTDEMSITLVNPSGVQIGPLQEVLGPQRFRVGQTELLLYYGMPAPYSTRQEIFIDFLPVNDYIASGAWQIILAGNRVVDGRYDLWLPGGGVLNSGTGFTRPSAQATMTIPATASRVITIGAYDARTFTYAAFSGRGPADENTFWETAKPDLVAPGVAVRSMAAGGGYGEYTGTSFAVPFATGSAALLMEWGIIKENDPYLYGEKVKAYLRRGARELPGFAEYPNNQVGYGRLCLSESIPK
ncbi:S8 family peptidase [Dorea ammoniilytica]